MTLRLACALLCAAAAARAELQLFVRNGAVETPVTAEIDFGSAAPAETLEVRFRVRNPGALAETVSTLAVNGPGFVLFDEFSLPRIVAPGFFADFGVRFTAGALGLQRGSVRVNALQVALRASAAATATLQMEAGGAWRTLGTDAAFDLGSVERRATLERRFRLVNLAGGAVFANPAALSGEAFRLAGAPAAPALLEPNASLPFSVTFQAEKAGVYAATLVFERHSYPLRAEAREFAPPRPAIRLGPAKVESGAQVKVTVELESPAKGPALGALQIDFTPAAGLPDDPAIALLPAATRRAPFSVAEGASQAAFGAAGDVILQTGTLSGRVTLTVVLGPWVERFSYEIAAAPPAVEGLRAVRKLKSVAVSWSGYDNARTLGDLRFTFYLTDGTALPQGALSADVREPFRLYYAANPLTGGAYRLEAEFPATGTLELLGAVEVELANSAGTRRPPRVTIE